MKILYLKALKINFRFVLLFSMAIILLQSCGKTDSKSGVAALMFIHSSPGLSPVDFYVNGNRINGDTSISYTDTIPYRFTNSGAVPVTVKKHISSITYISKAVELDPEKHYSFFVAGKPESVSYVLTQDNFIAPPSGKAKIRFLNLSPDSQPFDFKLGSATTLFTGQAFKSYTDFTTLDPGSHTFGIFEQGNSGASATLSAEVEAGRFYTVWAKGIKGSPDTETALSLQMISVK